MNQAPARRGISAGYVDTSPSATWRCGGPARTRKTRKGSRGRCGDSCPAVVPDPRPVRVGLDQPAAGLLDGSQGGGHRGPRDPPAAVALPVNRQPIRQSGRSVAPALQVLEFLVVGSSAGEPYWHQPTAAPHPVVDLDQVREVAPGVCGERSCRVHGTQRVVGHVLAPPRVPERSADELSSAPPLRVTPCSTCLGPSAGTRGGGSLMQVDAPSSAWRATPARAWRTGSRRPSPARPARSPRCRVARAACRPSRAPERRRDCRRCSPR